MLKMLAQKTVLGYKTETLKITADLKNRMIKEGRIILDSPSDCFANYWVSISFGTFALFVLLFKLILEHNSISVVGILFFLLFTLIFVVAPYLMQRVELRLEKETLDLEKDEIHQILGEVGEKFGWLIVFRSDDILIADSIRVFAASHRITVLIDGKDIYINARSRGPEISLFRKAKLTDTVRSDLRMKYFEIQHQRGLGK